MLQKNEIEAKLYVTYLNLFKEFAVCFTLKQV